MVLNIGEIVKGKDIGYQSCGNNRYIWLACPKCGKPRWVMLSRAKQTNNQIWCRQCSPQKRSRVEWSGTNNPQWRGGRHKLAGKGYIEVWLPPDDPYRSMIKKRGNHTTNYVLEHRLVMAQFLGRPLESWEVVHHLNGKKDDNRIENLLLVNSHTHERYTVTKLLHDRIATLESIVAEQKQQIKLLIWTIKDLKGTFQYKALL